MNLDNPPQTTSSAIRLRCAEAFARGLKADQTADMTDRAPLRSWLLHAKLGEKSALLRD